MKNYDPIPNYLLETFREERCVLFIGAGVSANSGIPIWSDMLNFAYQELKNHYNEDIHKLDLLQIAQYYEFKVGRVPLIEKISRQIQLGRGVNDNHKQITRLPINTIITTNWDDLIETAFKKHNLFEPKVVWEDKQLGMIDTILQPLIIKMHGDIKDPDYLVITEKDYLDFFYTRPVLEKLISTTLANSTVLFLGYSISDFDLKLIINRIFSILGEMRPNMYILLTNKKKAYVEYIQSLGLRSIIYQDESKGHGELLTLFLNNLLEEVSIVADNAIDRAKILVRENNIEIKHASKSMFIRSASNLGGWGTPCPSKNEEPIYDEMKTPYENRIIDKYEWEASKRWKEFYEKGAQYKCIYCIDSTSMLKKYTKSVAKKRFNTFLKNIREINPNQVKIVNKGSPVDYSMTIFGENVLIEFHRAQLTSKTYDRGYVTRNKLSIKHSREVFDMQFDAIKLSNLREMKDNGIYESNKSREENLKKYIIWKTEQVIEQIK